MAHFPSLQISLRPSRLLLTLGGVTHLLAAVAVMVSSLAAWFKIGLIAGIGLALLRFGWRYGHHTGPGFISGVALAEDRWHLRTGTGACQNAIWSGGYAHTLLVILHFRLEHGRPRSLVVLPDAADPDGLRRLRVWIRTRATSDADDTADFEVTHSKKAAHRPQ